MLYTRLQFLQTYLQDTKNGVIPIDHDILRQISSLCLRSPVTDQAAFDDQFSRVMAIKSELVGRGCINRLRDDRNTMMSC